MTSRDPSVQNVPNAPVIPGDDAPMRLVGRSSSHFTRVVRIVASELGVPITLEVLDDILSVDPTDYGGHPAMKIPTLRHGDTQLFGTDNICRRIAERAGRIDDARVFLSHHVASDHVRNAQEVVWTAMALQVQLALGVQVARLSPDNIYFAKARVGLRGAVAWLEAELDLVLEELPADRQLSLLEVTLYCLLDHIAFRPTLPLADFAKLRAFAARFSIRDAARRTPYHFDRPVQKESPAMTLKRPALDPATLAPRTTSAYPEVFRARVTPREKRALGDALGLTQFGVNLTTLFPGKESSLRHHHAHEDELVFILEGELVLRTDEGEQLLSAGMCAGFPAGTTNGHQLVNRSTRPARYLEVGTRAREEVVGYPEDDLACRKGPDGAWVFTHRDGRPW